MNSANEYSAEAADEEVLAKIISLKWTTLAAAEPGRRSMPFKCAGVNG